MKAFKLFLKIIIQIMTLILFALLIVAIYGKAQMLLFKQEYASMFGYTMFQVASGSMEPALSINDVIVVKINDDIEVNDIISFVDKGTIITHRVLSINENSVTVKGDANNTIDMPIDRSVVIGKVIKVYPELKIWQDVLSDPKILVVLFITLLSFDFAFSYKKKDEKVKNKLEKSENVKVIQIQKPVKDVIEDEDLLALTRQLDLTEIQEILEKDQMKGFAEEERKALYNTLLHLKKEDIEAFVLPKLKEKEKNIEEYTLRLDLKAIQKQILKKMK